MTVNGQQFHDSFREGYAKQQGRVLDDIIRKRQDEMQKMKAADLPIVAASTPGVKLLSELGGGTGTSRQTLSDQG